MSTISTFTANEVQSIHGSLQAFNVRSGVKKQNRKPVAIELHCEDDSYTISKVVGSTGIAYYQLLGEETQIVSSNKRKFIDAMLNLIIN